MDLTFRFKASIIHGLQGLGFRGLGFNSICWFQGLRLKVEDQHLKPRMNVLQLESNECSSGYPT